jgi:uncharacterized protein YfdQ (DUF2303 family)
MEENSETFELHRLANAAKVHAANSEVPFVLVPEGHKLTSLEELQVRPRRIEQKVALTTVASFVEFVNASKQPSTIILANDKSRNLRAIIDYHQGPSEPSWCKHEASYATELSREAKIWFENDNKVLSQVAFAELLEDRVADIVTPTGAALLEIALKLQVIQKAVVGSVIRLQSGEFQMNWSQENEKGTVEVPEKIVLGIPLFHGDGGYKIEARLRYRLNEGKVTFTYKIIDREANLEHAFTEIVSKVRAELSGAPIYFGSR